MPRFITLAILAAAALAATVGLATGAASPFTASATRGHGQELLTIRSTGSARHYQLCVNPPRAGTTCHRYALHARGGGVFGSTVAWGHHFPYEGPGTYAVTWRHSGHVVGTARFHWSVCPPFGHVRTGLRNYRRLVLIDRCRSVRGQVAGVTREADGDMHLDFRPAAGGRLVVEFMPRDRGHLPGFRHVQGFVRRHTPLRLTGAYVCDSNHHRANAKPDASGRFHGWREIHPVFRVEQLGPKGHVLQTWVSGPQYPLAVHEPGSLGQFACP